MDRIELLTELMKKKNLKNYLEIGVFNGRVFFRIKSSFKVAVDPSFAFDSMRKIGKTISNPYNLANRYFEKTSDEFFKTDAAQVFAKEKCNLAFIDGMHEYKFALRDVENTLNYLSDDGVIVMHDCNPQTKEDAGTFEDWKKRGSGYWNGDVWKTILHLRCFRKDINVFVLDCDHGLGVVTKGRSESNLQFSEDEINKFTYGDFEKNRASWLNLKPERYYQEFFKI
ncbi:hypothetical protein WSM22_16910 [Cytophagales bacterium WSM2-2]|nr:hypothetical protein WSM22_16910 [Cytophagales bacterium WSM2-2]